MLKQQSLGMSLSKSKNKEGNTARGVICCICESLFLILKLLLISYDFEQFVLIRYIVICQIVNSICCNFFINLSKIALKHICELEFYNLKVYVATKIIWLNRLHTWLNLSFYNQRLVNKGSGKYRFPFIDPITPVPCLLC